jgi:very-short-patch-repair endonuclease
MTDLELGLLLRFYLACVEAEDRRSLTKRLDAIHRSLVSPWSIAEPLFHPGAAAIRLDVELESDRTVLLGAPPAGAGAERFFYGYPIFLDLRGCVSPLFVTEVDLERCGPTGFVMRVTQAGEIRVNDQFFRRRRLPPEELRALQSDLERDHRSFSARLRAAFAALGAPAPQLGRSPLDPYPANGSPGDRWVNRPILFKSEKGAYTHHLRRELEALAGTPRLREAVAGTAAGMLTGSTASRSAATARQAPPAALLEVLPLNQGQEVAARAALTQDFSVVTGPPGTGKSQLVVDLLASCAHAGKPVLFASKNNRAIDVVRARLRALLGEDRDWTLRLGSRNAMDEARREMSARLDRLVAGAAPPAPSPQLVRALDQAVAGLRGRIEALERARRRYAALDRARRVAEDLVEPGWTQPWRAGAAQGPVSRPHQCPIDRPHRQRLERLHQWPFERLRRRLERLHPPRLEHLHPPPIEPLRPRRIERLHARSGSLAGRRRIGPWLWLRRALAPAALAKNLHQRLRSLAEPLPEPLRTDLERSASQPSASRFGPLADACGQLARLVRWRIADDDCARAFAALCAHQPAAVLASRLDGLTHRRAGLARDQLRGGWTGRLAAGGAAARLALDDYFDLASRLRQSRRATSGAPLDRFENAVLSLAGHLPIWVVSSLSVRNAIPLEPALFDLVIVDEASQCDIASALPLLFRARRALIIGDPRQLRHISALSPEEEEILAAAHGVEHLLQSWSYRQCSLFAAARRSAIARGAVPALLAEHYRSHPAIVDFPNRWIYQGRLIVRTPVAKLREKLGSQPLGLFWHDCPGAVPHSSASARNEIEVLSILALLDRWWRDGSLARQEVDFGIVTPFRLQMERLDEAIRRRPWWEEVEGRLTVGTAHRFQGDERDVMIFSPVVARGMPPGLVRWVAATDQLLNVAITRARGALHVVGDRGACLAAGGCLGAFAAAAGDGATRRQARQAPGSPATARMAALLAEAGLAAEPQVRLGAHRLDFLAVAPFGARYDIEVDGRESLSDGAAQSDDVRDAALAAAGIKVLRIEARQVLLREDAVRELLRRLV